MAEPMKNRMFRLTDADFAILKSIADALSQSTGLPAKRSDALRIALREKAQSLGISVKQDTPKRKK